MAGAAGHGPAAGWGSPGRSPPMQGYTQDPSTVDKFGLGSDWAHPGP